MKNLIATIEQFDGISIIEELHQHENNDIFNLALELSENLHLQQNYVNMIRQLTY